MASGSIPLPALDVRPPQPNDALGSFQKLMALRSLANQQQIQQQQITSQQQEQQLRQQQIQDQQLTQQYLRKNPSSTFGDAADALRGQISLPAYQNLVDADAKIRQSHAAANEAELKNRQTAHDQYSQIFNNAMNLSDADLAQQSPQIVQQINSVPGGTVKLDPNQPLTKDSLKSFGVPLALNEAYLKQEADKRKETAETEEAQGKGAEAQATAEQKRTESQFYANAGFGAPGVPTETASMLQYLRQNHGKTPLDYYGQKAATEAAATQPYKIETAVAEGKARQLIQGLGESVYAFMPDGSRQLMSKTDAIQAGVRTMTPVTEKQVGDDIQLVNRLGDVRQKVARYEQSLANLGTTVTAKDQGNIAALIAHGGFKVGAFGTELPMDRLNSALQRENISGLSDDAKKLLVSYYNARESMQGYTRVLSGSGRSNEKAMELNLDALPSPAISDRSYAQESLNQFKENLGIVGQGLPRIPGIKSPEEIEAQVTGGTHKASPSAPSQSASKFNIGDSVLYQGRPHKITAIDPKTGKLSLAP